MLKPALPDIFKPGLIAKKIVFQPGLIATKLQLSIATPINATIPV
ncbi:MAG TPA: hypothetical protein V6D09_26480 [Leptolyngbyaceae cyanobacterium]